MESVKSIERVQRIKSGSAEKREEYSKGITTEKAINLLQKQGIKLNPENARQVIDYLYILANIFYSQQQEHE